ncbi:mannose-6-phosphate isomerase [Streptosporangiaceae bacterium NEAU-GS5]|nr:mannose-6-phosphate isomerase [Streptosporangiaceae bacterium NEAU-GS5]
MIWEPDRLDDQAYLQSGDSAGMLPLVASSAAQVRMAYRSAVEAGAARAVAQFRPRAIVVVGMGASGVAGNVLEALCSVVPVIVVRGYRLPGWVGAADLLIAVSSSGATEETLAVATEGVRRGCAFLGVGAPDSPLQSLAVQGGAPYVAVTPAAGQSRATLWSLAVPPLVVTTAMGVTDAGEDVFEAVAKRLEDVAHRCRPSSESFINPGKTLAAEIAESLPMVWGSSPIAAVAAQRLACQLNENGKYPAIWGELPEVNHNQVEALDGALAERDVFADEAQTRLRLFVLRDVEEHPQVARRREVSVRLAEDRGVPVSEVLAEGEHPLERLASLVCMADYASVYLALGYGVDPTPMSAIAELKARISP